LNLLLAVFYNNYKNRISKKVDEFNVIRQDYFAEQFNEIDIEKKGYITTQDFR
jgi:hypothetical protein